MATAEEMLARIKGMKAKYSARGDTYKLKEGKTTIRIVDPDDSMTFSRDFGQHWIKPEKNAKPVAVVGSRMITYNEPCPIQTMIDKAKRVAVDDASLEVINEWAAKKVVLVPAIIRSGPDANEDQAQILELTPTVFGQIMNMVEEYFADQGYILNVKTGVDLVIERSGKGLDTKYTVIPKMGTAKPVSKAALEKLPNIDEFIAKKFLPDDVTKAVNAITAITGVAPAVGAALGHSAAAGALTGPSTVSDLTSAKLARTKPAEVVELTESDLEEPAGDEPEKVAEPEAPAKAEVKKTETKKAEAAAATASDSELEDILKGLDDL